MWRAQSIKKWVKCTITSSRRKNTSILSDKTNPASFAFQRVPSISYTSAVWNELYCSGPRGCKGMINGRSGFSSVYQLPPLLDVYLFDTEDGKAVGHFSIFSLPFICGISTLHRRRSIRSSVTDTKTTVTSCSNGLNKWCDIARWTRHDERNEFRILFLSFPDGREIQSRRRVGARVPSFPRKMANHHAEQSNIHLWTKSKEFNL